MCVAQLHYPCILYTYIFLTPLCIYIFRPLSFQPSLQNPIQTTAKPTSAVDLLAQKAVHPSIHRPLKVVVQPFLISTDLLYPGERMSCSVCTCVYCGAVWCSCQNLCILIDLASVAKLQRPSSRVGLNVCVCAFVLYVGVCQFSSVHKALNLKSQLDLRKTC